MRTIKLEKLLVFALMFSSLVALGQQIKGKVLDESNEPLIGANIIVVGTSNGTTTDFDGNFMLKVDEFPATLEISSVGYATQQKKVSSAGNVNVIMEEDATSLEEVVITGLAGTSVKKSNAANAVSSISAQDLVGTTPPATIDGALYGKFTGAIVSSNSGAPGGGMSVKMRGITSIQGNSQPLYIVDGVYIDNSSVASGLNLVSKAASGGSASNQDNPTNRIADINPDDIENIEILKGASAAAIYGSRAAAGVVIITTKKGKSGKTKINLRQSTGVTSALKLLGMRDYNEDRVKADFGDEALAQYIEAKENGRLVDYEKELYGNKGFITKTALSASGGGEKTKFFAGVSHLDEDGIVKETGYTKSSIRLNLDNKITDNIKLSLNTNYIKSSSDRGFFNNDNSGTTMGVSLTSTTPWLDLFPVNGEYPDNPAGASNILQTRDLVTNNESNSRFLGGGNLDIKIFSNEKSNLKALLRGGIDTYIFETTAIFPRKLQFMKVAGGLGGVSSQGTSKVFNSNVAAFLIHNFTTDGNINFRTQAGVTNENFDTNNILTSATGLVTGQTNLDLAANRGTTQNRLQQEDAGFFVQEEINIKDILILTAGLRGDKSTNNTDPNEFFYYPKGSLAFNITEALQKGESIEKETLSLLKLRAAYGESGNFPFFGANRTIFGSTNVSGLSGITLAGQLGDPNITPERQKELEFGADLGFVNDRVNLAFTYYIKNVNDMIINSAIEPSTGFTSQVVNAGNLENKGIEAGLNITPFKNENVQWNLGFNFFKNKSKITKLNVPAYNLGAFGATLGTFRLEEGKSATQIVGIGKDGLTVYGDAEADFQLSWQNNLKVKNFDFSFLWHWKKGGDNVNLTALLTDLNKTSHDYDTIDLDPSGTLGNGPYRLSQLGVSAEPFVEDASYIRLREVGVYYNIPSKTLKSAFGETISSFSLGFSGNNLLNFFDYNSYDPEVSNFGTNGISTGVEVTPFPSSKRYMFHLTLGL